MGTNLSNPTVTEAPQPTLTQSNSSSSHSTLNGGGEMGALMRALDWSVTSVGPVNSWPQSLRIAVRILLGSGYPMLICWGPTYTMLYNDAYRPILGRTKHPGAVGRSCRDVFPEAWDFIGPLFDKVMTQGEDASTLTDQLFLLDRNGYLEECYYTFSYSPIPDDEGGVGGVFVTALETTERVIEDRRMRTLRDLASRTSQARTEEEVFRIAAAILAENQTTLPFTLLYSCAASQNSAVLKATSGGVAPSMLPGTTECGSLDPWPFESVRASGVEEVITDLGARFSDLPNTTWGVPTNSAAVLPLKLKEFEGPTGFLVVGLNPRREYDAAYREFLHRISQQIATALAGARAYEQEKQRAEALMELDRAKTTFFSNVSHEFRTPLTLMLGPLEDSLKDASNTAEQRERLGIAHRNSLRLLKLVNTLLDFSRIEAGRVQAAYELTDVSAFTADIASGFRSAMEKAGLTFTVNCEPVTQPVYIDREMWEKIVLNLLSNAFKFTFTGEIELRIRARENRFELSVSDTGVGIPKEELPRIFERFHRIENTKSRTYEGTGIGLALVQELAKLHGATVVVESELGRGSTFTVSVPAGKEHLPQERIGAKRTLTSTALGGDTFVEEALRWQYGAPEPLPTRHLASSTPAPQSSSEAGQELILLADDNADMREYVTHLLVQRYRVHSVSDGEKALQAARELRPALILSDVMMPVLDGFGLVQAIREDPQLRSTPVILVSARAGEEAQIEGLHAGADDYLSKPFTVRELMARIETHLRMAGLRREAAERESRLRAEAEAERRRLQELLAQAPAAMGMMTGPEHRWTYVNDFYVQVTGRKSRSDFIGKTIRESLPEIENQVFIGLLDQVYRTGEPFIGREMRAILNRSEGGKPEEAFFNFVYQPVRDAQGAVTGVLVHAVEVTDQVNARKRVEQSEARLRLAQAAAQIGTWEWDPANGSTSLSPALHEIFGTDSGDAEHVQKWVSHVYAADWERLQREMEQGHRAGHMEFEYRYVHPNKGLRWFYCKGRRVYDESRMFGVVLDITDRKLAELRLAAQQKVSHALATSADLSEAAPQILRAVCDVLDWKVGGLWTVDPSTQAMRCNQTYAASPLRFAMESCNQALKRGQGLPGRVWERGAPVWIQDVVSDSNFPRAALAAEEKLHSAFGFPIMQRGLVLGALEFLSDEIREPDADLLDMMSAIGAQVGQYLDRVQAQDALRESEERYRTVAETASDAIVSIDEKSTILFANSATQEVFGYTPEELIGQPLTTLMPPNMRHRHDAGLQRYLNTGEKHLSWDAAELPGLHKSGREIPLEVSFGQYSKAGKHYFTGFARDITQRKNAEQALRRSEEEFRALANSVPQLVWMANADGWIFWYNQRWYEYTGTTPEQMQGWGWQTVHDPATLPDVLHRWRQSLATGTPFEMVFPLKGADGKFRSFLTRVNPIRDDKGQIVRWFGTNTDISSQQEILQALKVSQESLRAALMASDTGTFRWDPNTGQFLHFDDNLKRLFGIPREERVRNTEDFLRRVHPEDLPALEPAVEACRNGADFEMEYRVVLPDGSIRWLYDRAKMESENGRPMYLVGACTDITARKLSEQALLQTEKLAAAGRLAATVAHEINNPLEAVTNYIFLAMRNKDLPPTVKRHLQIADQELSRVTHIAQQTLGFYRATSGPTLVDAKELIQDVLRIYERKFSYKNLKIQTEVEPGLIVYGAPGELKQVLSNLVANALDASMERGAIRIRAKSWKRVGHRGAAITVADSGTGMSREVADKAFTAFFTTKKDVGTGLGLWASKNIVEKHHGTIRIRSRQGKHSGTIVRIILPPQRDVN